MPLNFPNSPVVDQVYQAEGVAFVWSGVAWYVPTPFPWATDVQAIAGVRNDVVMTPDSLDAALDALPVGAASFPFGVPTDYSGSRAHNTNYQNTTGRPMMVAATFNDRDSASVCEARIGPTNISPPSVNVGRMWSNRGSVNLATIVFVVPTSWYYRLHRVERNATVDFWWEWR